MLCPYIRLRKEAIDIYAEEIKNSDLSTEAKVAALLNAKQTIKQLRNKKNVADIAASNAKEGTDFSEKSGIDEEWFDRYMEAASFVSSEETQIVWGKILANEFEVPGSTPRNMTRILSEFTRNYAEAFRKICCMRVVLIQIDENDRIVNTTQRNVIPFLDNSIYMKKLNLTFELMNELDTIGVIKFDTIAGFAALNITTKKVLVYASGRTIEIGDHEEGNLPIGNVFFTDAGEALKRITDIYEIDDVDYMKALIDYYKTRSVELDEDPQYRVDTCGDTLYVSKNVDTHKDHIETDKSKTRDL